MTSDALARLRTIPIFAGLDDERLAKVAALATDFEAEVGHVLVERGQAGTGLFVIEEGSVRVDLPSGGSVERGEGDFVGELAVLADTPRTARVSVSSPLRCLAIRREDLVELLDQEPTIAVAMLREVARRLAEATPQG